MDGDIAPLPELCDLAEKYGCIMMVDDAPQRRTRTRRTRTIDHFNCHGRVHIQVGTLSKAIVRWRLRCGSRDLIDFFTCARGRFFLDFASARNRRRLPGRFHAARFAGRRKARQEIVGQHKIFKRELKKRGFQFKSVKRHHSDSRRRRAKAFEFSGNF